MWTGGLPTKAGYLTYLGPSLYEQFICKREVTQSIRKCTKAS